MTDTGQVPGEGLPENAGGRLGQPHPADVHAPPADAGYTEQPQPGVPPGAGYTFLDAPDTGGEEDDLLLMPGAQGAWSEQQAQYEQQMQAPMQPPYPQAQGHGLYEGGVLDPGMAAYADTQMPEPQPVAEPQAGPVAHPAPEQPAPQRPQAPAAPPTPPRRPLHMGPPVPDTSGGVVRSLADRGPAASRNTAPPVQQPQTAPPPEPEYTGGVDYASAPEYAAGPQYFTTQPHQPQPQAEDPGTLPGPQLADIPQIGDAPPPGDAWDPQPPPPAPAETVGLGDQPMPPMPPEGAQPAAMDLGYADPGYADAGYAHPAAPIPPQGGAPAIDIPAQIQPGATPDQLHSGPHAVIPAQIPHEDADVPQPYADPAAVDPGHAIVADAAEAPAGPADPAAQAPVPEADAQAAPAEAPAEPGPVDVQAPTAPGEAPVAEADPQAAPGEPSPAATDAAAAEAQTAAGPAAPGEAPVAEAAPQAAPGEVPTEPAPGEPSVAEAAAAEPTAAAQAPEGGADAQVQALAGPAAPGEAPVAEADLQAAPGEVPTEPAPGEPSVAEAAAAEPTAAAQAPEGGADAQVQAPAGPAAPGEAPVAEAAPQAAPVEPSVAEASAADPAAVAAQAPEGEADAQAAPAQGQTPADPAAHGAVPVEASAESAAEAPADPAAQAPEGEAGAQAVPAEASAEPAPGEPSAAEATAAEPTGVAAQAPEGEPDAQAVPAEVSAPAGPAAPGEAPVPEGAAQGVPAEAQASGATDPAPAADGEAPASEADAQAAPGQAPAEPTEGEAPATAEAQTPASEGDEQAVSAEAQDSAEPAAAGETPGPEADAQVETPAAEAQPEEGAPEPEAAAAAADGTVPDGEPTAPDAVEVVADDAATPEGETPAEASAQQNEATDAEAPEAEAPAQAQAPAPAPEAESQAPDGEVADAKAPGTEAAADPAPDATAPEGKPSAAATAPEEPDTATPDAEADAPEGESAEAQDEAADPAPDGESAQPAAAEGEATAEGTERTEQADATDHDPEADPADAESDAPAPIAVPFGPRADAGYDDAERAAVHRVMRERRDIRNGFRPDPIPHEVLLRVLEAAHTAPSVGQSQPWDFVVIRSEETRRTMHELAVRQRDAYAKSLPKGRAKQFKELKIEAILETPINIVVTADPTRGGRHTLGRHTQPQMAPYSSALAVENLWLAARAEGLGVGWVSFFDEREMVRTLGLPDHLEAVAYLCVGYVDEFPEEPELLRAGWSKRRPLSWVVHEETYGRRALPGEDPHSLLTETLQGIRPLDAKALGEAWERQKRMTKPSGALGMLEIISAQLSGLSRQCPPPIPEPAAVAIFAGDHGVHAQGVTAWPQEVTGQMVANFLGGGAVCNAFASQVGAEVCVVDVGVTSELPSTPGLLPRKVRAGTGDFTTGPALTREEVLQALEVGIETARDLVAAGNKALLTGEMGIANTTTSAALVSVYTGADPAEVTGRGTGINDEMHARKIDVVRRGLELHQPDPADPIGVLCAFGGLEHAAMAGLLLGGASLRTPVILDGVSAGAAALVARAIAPEVLAACIAGHRSAEPGHVAALNKLGLRPLVDLDLRLGEGTGALLALPVVQSAARAMHEVATFDSAGVTEKN